MKTAPNEPIKQEIINRIDNTGKTVSVEYYGGLTKREYFAAMAMQGYVSGYNLTPDRTANVAVRMADALIKELNK